MFQCAYRTGLSSDPSRTDWQDAGPRPISWSAWYPAKNPDLTPREISGSFCKSGLVIPDAELASGEPFPVVMMSHGTGGSAESLGWLARELACAGYVVIGANHHGNTATEPHRAEGFLCWWERAADLSVLLSELSVNGPFAGRLDASRVSAIGFSLGAHTVLALAGAITSFAAFNRWKDTVPEPASGPREFPDLAEHLPGLLETSDAFRESWGRQSADYADARMRSIVAIAPPPPVRAFTPESLRQISTTTHLITGGSDKEAPTEQCAVWLVEKNPAFHHHSVGEFAGHYSFLGLPTKTALLEAPELFEDHPSVRREDVHSDVVRIVLSALN